MSGLLRSARWPKAAHKKHRARMLSHAASVAGSQPVLNSPFGGGALRYVSAIELPAGLRLHYESATEYGSHEVRTELQARP